jgi:hypothetical protein
MNTQITPAQYADRKYVNKWTDSPAQKGGNKSKESKVGFHCPEMMKVRDEVWSVERMKRTEEEYPKERILEAHSKCKTFNQVIDYLGIWWGTYLRLCEVYTLKPIKWDKTTKNSGPSKPILVYRLIEFPYEIYSSKKEAQRSIFPSDKKIGLRIREGELNYDKKIDYQTDKEGRKIRARLTGKQTQIGNRTPSNEIQIYELVEEFVEEFPSREEVYRKLGDLAIQSQLNGKIYQSKGYRFYELN